MLREAHRVFSLHPFINPHSRITNNESRFLLLFSVFSVRSVVNKSIAPVRRYARPSDGGGAIDEVGRAQGNRGQEEKEIEITLIGHSRLVH